jgi:hypothetical protein
MVAHLRSQAGDGLGGRGALPVASGSWISVLAACALGCVHGRGPELRAEVVEAAYVQGRAGQVGCRAGDARCCAGQARAARAATAGGDALRAARLWHELALACPERRREATVAVLERGPAAGTGAAAPGSRAYNVSYRPRLSPAYRLYWVAAAIGQRLLPMVASPSSATGLLTVQVQAIRFTGGRSGPLLVIEQTFDVEEPFSPEATVTVEITEADGGAGAPLAISARVDPVDVPRNPPAARPPAPRPAVRVDKPRALRLDPARAPGEFDSIAGRRPPLLRVCLDREGQVDTVRLLEPVHPRFAASLIDMLRDSRHEPYRVNDQAVPSCDLLQP